MVERLTDLMKQTLVPVNQAIEQYYSMELRFPLSVFSGIVGKNRLESLLYLLSDESLHKYRNNPFYRKICKQDTLLLSYECVVMASYMDALKDIRSRYQVVCTEQVKAQLISDIDELLRNIRDETCCAYCGAFYCSDRLYHQCDRSDICHCRNSAPAVVSASGSADHQCRE